MAISVPARSAVAPYDVAAAISNTTPTAAIRMNSREDIADQLIAEGHHREGDPCDASCDAKSCEIRRATGSGG
jgi:hypothetical protein